MLLISLLFKLLACYERTQPSPAPPSQIWRAALPPKSPRTPLHLRGGASALATQAANPTFLSVPLLGWRELTAPGAPPEAAGEDATRRRVIELELDCSATGWALEPGDCFGVRCANADADVDDLLAVLFDGGAASALPDEEVPAPGQRNRPPLRPRPPPCTAAASTDGATTRIAPIPAVPAVICVAGVAPALSAFSIAPAPAPVLSSVPSPAALADVPPAAPLGRARRVRSGTHRPPPRLPSRAPRSTAPRPAEPKYLGGPPDIAARLTKLDRGLQRGEHKTRRRSRGDGSRQNRRPGGRRPARPVPRPARACS